VQNPDSDWEAWTERNQSDIATLFYGQTERHLACEKCGEERSNWDIVNLFHVPLSRYGEQTRVSLVDLLAHAATAEQEAPHECPADTENSSNQIVFWGTRFHRLPQVLIIDLTRVSGENDPVKNRTEVDFERELDMGPWSTPGHQGASDAYRLHAVLVHRGGPKDPTAHYIAYVRIEDQWLAFLDLQVRRVVEYGPRNPKACFLFYVSSSVLTEGST
jgi:ubiquitin C-terminal hydrolase